MFLSESKANLKTLNHWLWKGFWTVADQGLFSTSNFALSVLLARWLSPQDYGAFAVVFSVFLLISTLHTGLLAEPMAVFGPGRYEGRFSEYLGSLLYGHLGFALVIGFPLVLVGLGLAISGTKALSTTLLALAFAGPLILLLWLMRRSCYARFEPSLAAWGSALYMALMLAGAYALYRLEWLSAAAAFGVMGISSLVVSLWLVARLRVEWPSFRDDGLIRGALEDHWKYGRWTAATQLLFWCPVNIYFLLLPVWSGLEASASLRALMNLTLPMLLILGALSSSLLLPTLVQARGDTKFATLVRFSLVFFLLGSLLYWLFLGLFHNQLIFWLYGGQYAEDADLLWLLGLLPLGQALVSVLGTALQAYERPDRVFWACAFSTAMALTVGLLMTSVWGVSGAVIGILVSEVVAAGATAYYFLKIFGKRAAKKGAECD